MVILQVTEKTHISGLILDALQKNYHIQLASMELSSFRLTTFTYYPGYESKPWYPQSWLMAGCLFPTYGNFIGFDSPTNLPTQDPEILGPHPLPRSAERLRQVAVDSLGSMLDLLVSPGNGNLKLRTIPWMLIAIYNNVGKTTINQPFGNNLYHLSMVIWGMVYYCFTHINLYLYIHKSYPILLCILNTERLPIHVYLTW